MLNDNGHNGLHRIGCQVRHTVEMFPLMLFAIINTFGLHDLGLSHVRWNRKTIQLYMPKYNAVPAKNAHL